jgi:hypothetical protein
VDDEVAGVKEYVDYICRFEGVSAKCSVQCLVADFSENSIVTFGLHRRRQIS